MEFHSIWVNPPRLREPPPLLAGVAGAAAPATFAAGVAVAPLAAGLVFFCPRREPAAAAGRDRGRAACDGDGDGDGEIGGGGGGGGGCPAPG
jgi:hypothetical protein